MSHSHISRLPSVDEEVNRFRFVRLGVKLWPAMGFTHPGPSSMWISQIRISAHSPERNKDKAQHLSSLLWPVSSLVMPTKAYMGCMAIYNCYLNKSL